LKGDKPVPSVSTTPVTTNPDDPFSKGICGAMIPVCDAVQAVHMPIETALRIAAIVSPTITISAGK
jgi:hypothetical protein